MGVFQVQFSPHKPFLYRPFSKRVCCCCMKFCFCSLAILVTWRLYIGLKMYSEGIMCNTSILLRFFLSLSIDFNARTSASISIDRLLNCCCLHCCNCSQTQSKWFVAWSIWDFGIFHIYLLMEFVVVLISFSLHQIRSRFHSYHPRLGIPDSFINL